MVISRRLLGPQSSSGSSEEEKILSTPAGIRTKNTPFVQPMFWSLWNIKCILNSKCVNGVQLAQNMAQCWVRSLWTCKWKVGFHQRRVISWLAERSVNLKKYCAPWIWPPIVMVQWVYVEFHLRMKNQKECVTVSWTI